MIGAKPLSARLEKINWLIRVIDRTKYLVLFSLEKHGGIYDWIRCFIALKGGIRYVFSYSYAEIKTDSDDDISPEKMLTLHNVIRLIMILITHQNLYYYNTFLEKCYYQLAKK